MAEHLTVTFVNHAAVDIAATADAVWDAILDNYVDAGKFRAFGTVEALDDPAAPLGGYRMCLRHGDVLDERIVHVTERDEAARRLSLHADYRSVPGGMQVFATYQAQETATGARYVVDCHSRMAIDAPAGGGREDIAATVAALTAQFDAALTDFAQGLKTILESAG